MNVMVAIWLSSIVGAMTFFAAGVLLEGVVKHRLWPGRLGDTAPSVQPSLTIETDRSARDQAKAVQGQLQAELDRRAEELTRVSAELEHLRGVEEQSRGKSRQAEAEVAAMRAQLRVTKQAVADQPRLVREHAARELQLKDNVAALAIDNEKLRTQSEATARTLTEVSVEQGRLQRELAGERERHKEAQKTIAELQLSLQRETELRLEQQRPQTEPIESSSNTDSSIDLATLQRKSTELSLQASVVAQQMDALDRQRELNHALSERIEELSGVQADNLALAARVRELEQRLFAHGEGARVSKPIPLTARPANARGPVLSDENDPWPDRLRQVLSGLRERTSGCDLALVSDRTGLVVSGAGRSSHHDEIAAAASVASYAGERIRELLPVGRWRSWEWIDAEGVALKTFDVGDGDDGLLLTTVCIAQTTNSAVVDQARDEIRRIVARHLDDGTAA